MIFYCLGSKLVFSFKTPHWEHGCKHTSRQEAERGRQILSFGQILGQKSVLLILITLRICIALQVFEVLLKL